MRYVDRSAIDAPASLTGPDSSGAKELERARIHFAAASPEPFSFKAYKAQDVRSALLKLFENRCAYCDSAIAATAPVDVEHYRPKGAVEDDSTHPGYWWLAAAWQNLLPSCIDCNRQRTHRIAAKGMTLAALITAALDTKCGKHKSFPIAQGPRARLESDNLALEVPLLLNPCTDNPDQHLGWDIDGDLSLTYGISANGDATVHLLGLNRQGLVEERTKLLLKLRIEYADIVDTFDLAATMESPHFEELVARAIIRLNRIRNSDQYEGLREAFWRRAVSELRDRYIAAFQAVAV